MMLGRGACATREIPKLSAPIAAHKSSRWRSGFISNRDSRAGGRPLKRLDSPFVFFPDQLVMDRENGPIAAGHRPFNDRIGSVDFDATEMIGLVRKERSKTPEIGSKFTQRCCRFVSGGKLSVRQLKISRIDCLQVFFHDAIRTFQRAVKFPGKERRESSQDQEATEKILERLVF